ncbi:MauE/DoxX family redox-associated membrane protein [Psychrobacillus sp.]|uniref:MauE/DoxX family redox-associated membrane protein n=1 Tax=Psychrobacillus sp. TaxID=1871623 RepID=UPI0028BDD24C|nr:MauE/DoxX family redox-associated membrane protein [Psychrobacillus sp.]
MELISLSCRIIIGLIFFSSAISKFSNMIEHIVVVRKYQILPPKAVKYFAYLDATIELIASLLILFGYRIELASLVILALVIVYTIAIIVNLIRGNRNMSCGCGGIIGDHNLSWLLPIRNILICSIMVFLMNYNGHIFSIDSLRSNSVYSLDSVYVFSTIVSSVLVIIVYSNLSSLVYISNSFKEILGKE